MKISFAIFFFNLYEKKIKYKENHIWSWERMHHIGIQHMILRSVYNIKSEKKNRNGLLLKAYSSMCV